MIDYKKLAKEVFATQNKVRKNPQSYIQPAKDMLKLFKGSVLNVPGQLPFMTLEGPSAVEELIRFLTNAQPIETLVWNDDMCMAANEYASELGSKGISEHGMPNNPSVCDRLEKYGEWLGKIGENVDFGGVTGEEIIIRLLIDDGNLQRPHRENIFNENFKVTGIACTEHTQHRTCTVIEYASSFIKKGHDDGTSSSREGDIHIEDFEGSGKVFGMNPNANIISEKKSKPIVQTHIILEENKRNDQVIIEKKQEPIVEKKDKKAKNKSKSGCFGFGCAKKQEKPKKKADKLSNDNIQLEDITDPNTGATTGSKGIGSAK